MPKINYITTDMNEMRYQNNNDTSDTSCFILKTIHYKKRRREKTTIMTQQSNVNNNNNQMENFQCLLCRKIIESTVPQQQENINIHKNSNMCIECFCSTNNISESNNINNIQPTRNNYEKSLTSMMFNHISLRKYNVNNIRYSKMCNFLINLSNIIRKSLLVLLLFNSLVMISSIQLVNAQDNSKFNSNVTAEPGVCHSIDIRNKPENLNVLSNCTVIEGFLQILLIDKYDTSAFTNYSFPNLVEVTDYVMFYRVNGLLSLRTLFPNLRIIRGNHIFADHALIIYEMLNLQEIGLINLMHIGRGAVRIEKNPNLCFVDTIEWSRITNESFADLNYIDSNKVKNLCGVCPQFEGNSTIECPKSKRSTGKDTYLCWNADHCQKECPPQCPGNCYDNASCCADHCAGGCSGPGTGRNNCTTCKHMMVYSDGKKHCVDNCTEGLFAYSSRSCITREACANIPVPIQVKKKDIPFPFVPREDMKCEMYCSQGYFAEVICQNKADLQTCRKICKKCEKDKCDKICSGTTVDSIASAQALKGCTKIEGSLEISIRSKGGTNIVRELESSLSSIEEITANLKIVRSYPLISLHFFKSLKRIRGVSNDQNEKSLVVIDNQNLQDLFNNTVLIDGGKIAFHYNPKLCLYKIEQFKKSLYPNISYDSEESMRNSNGDKVACNVTTLLTEAKLITHQFAIIGWKTFEIDDPRSLLGYVVYHTEAPFQNVTLYDGRDACGMDGWDIDDVGPGDDAHPLTKLKPYTQYAYYVKTLMISSEKHGGQSKIQYFKTLAFEPMQIQKLDVTSNASSEIVVNFKPPKRFNGEPDDYIIEVNITENRNIIYQRDYCLEPLKGGEDLPTRHIDTKPHEEPKKDICDCQNITCGSTSKGSLAEEEALEAITFEDKLHDWVYVKYTSKDGKDSRRRRRDVSYPTDAPTTIKKLIDNAKNETELSQLTEEAELVDDKGNVIFKRFRTNDTKVVIKQLKHYSWYSISVRACRKEEPSPTIARRCSPPQYKSARTRMVEGADDIPKLFTVQEHLNNSATAIKVSWEPPTDPNGFIVSYSIKYHRPEKSYKPHCVTAKEFDEKGFVLLENLDAGNYTIQVLATSMYGDGAYTAPQYQQIPEAANYLQTIITSAIVLVLLSVIGAAGFIYYFRQKFPAQVANMKLIASVNPEYISMQYTPDEWEVPREKIIQLQELGQGSFGMVYEGIIKDMYKPGDEQKCAIKTVNENATDRERINFLKEASVMKGFDTHHVVKLLGVCSSGQPTLVVMELMGNGDLKGYLRSHRPDRDSLDGPAPQPPSLRRVYQMAIEIADGMAYLAFKKFVHRDLAARNCMVAEDLTVKIGDFGMTRDIYETDYYRKGTKGLLPVRWMAPESLKDGVFTSSSDVFSYGVVLWEMATLASQPYQGLSNDQVLRYVIDGGVMERPENCPDKLYDLMRRCWTHRPSARPTFLEIVQELHADAHPTFRDLSFFDSIDGQRYLQEQQNVIPTIDDATTPLTRPEDEVESSIDDNNYLMNRTNSPQINKDISLQAIRSSQPLSGGIGSGIFSDPLVNLSIHPSSYRIDEEESLEVDDSAVDENHRKNENSTRLKAVTVAEDHNLKNGDNQQQRLKNLPHGSNSNAVAATVQQRPDAVAITVPLLHDTLNYVEQMAKSDDDKMVRNENSITQSEKVGFLQKFYNPNKRKPKMCDSISRYDGTEDDELTPINKEQNNIKTTPKKCLPNKTKQNPNDEEELRPLSNGYVVQNS